MTKKLRGSFSVYKETKKNSSFVQTEMLIISIVIGLITSSWFVWLISWFLLAGSMGTKIGLIIGWIVTIIWAVLTTVLLFAFSQNLEFSLVFGFIFGCVSWYKHDCGNLYWRDFAEAEWW
ncbi:hypothetical protein ACUUL3_11825 [Thiovibrio sp. JS02]